MQEEIKSSTSPHVRLLPTVFGQSLNQQLAVGLLPFHLRSNKVSPTHARAPYHRPRTHIHASLHIIGGLLMGMTILLLSWILTDYSTLILVRECQRDSHRTIEYHQLGTRAWGKWGGWTIAISLMLAQLAAACAYFVFVDEILSPMMKSISPTTLNHRPSRVIIPALTVVQVLLAQAASFSSASLSFPSSFSSITVFSSSRLSPLSDKRLSTSVVTF